MIFIKILTLLLIIILEQSIGQDMRSVRMRIMKEQQFQCVTTTCLPYFNGIQSNRLQCQINCISQSQCRAASFHHLNSTCQLFNSATNEYTNLETAIGSVAMIVQLETQDQLQHQPPAQPLRPHQHQPPAQPLRPYQHQPPAQPLRPHQHQPPAQPLRPHQRQHLRQRQ
ncbi:unnamed protein product [Adineta ricciae]|uniref:Apple domain-containing protein n=1 Tax=Adineta ricciae TaxID=249248 RepID=A0A815LA14_ADIRI|nr:unnamed protein product [Adineta ricciae]